MPLKPFDVLYPEIARRETHVCEAPKLLEWALPTKYFLREFYCTEEGCDCRRVLVRFLADSPRAEVAASVNFGWGKPAYYKKWSRLPDLWREMAGATLEPFAEQGPEAEMFLLIFEKIVQDPELVAAFRRHYALVKESLTPPPPVEWA
jgi:hypothetical protein